MLASLVGSAQFLFPEPPWAEFDVRKDVGAEGAVGVEAKDAVDTTEESEVCVCCCCIVVII